MKRVFTAIIGGALVLVGLVMLVTPGPALLVIPLGVAILAAEFAWASRWMAEIRRRLARKRICQAPSRPLDSGTDFE